MVFINSKKKIFNLSVFYNMIINQVKLEKVNESFQSNKLQEPSFEQNKLSEEKNKINKLYYLKYILDYPGKSPEDNIEGLLQDRIPQVDEERELSTRRKEDNESFNYQHQNKSMDLSSESFHFKPNINKSVQIRSRGKSQDDKSRKANFQAPKHMIIKKLRNKFKKDIFNKKKKKLDLPKTGGKFQNYYNFNLPDTFNKGENLWLLKVSAYNRGFGIELFKNLNCFFRHLFNFWFGYEESINETKSNTFIKCNLLGIKPSVYDKSNNVSTKNILKDLNREEKTGEMKSVQGRESFHEGQINKSLLSDIKSRREDSLAFSNHTIEPSYNMNNSSMYNC